MSTLQAVPLPVLTLRMLVARVLAQTSNQHTSRNYGSALKRFLKSNRPLSRQGVIEFLQGLEKPTVHTMARAALRKLAVEAEEAGYISGDESRAILRIKSRAKVQVRMGHWLSLEAVAKLRQLPNRFDIRGARDAVIIGLLVGCGLRRAEACGLLWSQCRQIDGRMVLVDIAGKGGRIRSVPVPDWAAREISNWQGHLTRRYHQLRQDPMGAVEGPVLRSLMRLLPDHPLHVNTLQNLIPRYAAALGLQFTAHDLRRTLAQLMRRAGAPIEQIQFTLGHAGIKTTERYLGGAIELEMGKAAVDLIQW